MFIWKIIPLFTAASFVPLFVLSNNNSKLTTNNDIDINSNEKTTALHQDNIENSNNEPKNVLSEKESLNQQLRLVNHELTNLNIQNEKFKSFLDSYFELLSNKNVSPMNLNKSEIIKSLESFKTIIDEEKKQKDLKVIQLNKEISSLENYCAMLQDANTTGRSYYLEKIAGIKRQQETNQRNVSRMTELTNEEIKHQEIIDNSGNADSCNAELDNKKEELNNLKIFKYESLNNKLVELNQAINELNEENLNQFLKKNNDLEIIKNKLNEQLKKLIN